ncbi:MAG: T9SS type A sorting domain-containing protein [Saprospiraceae bacterium]|nr:T9SS type A sorting domain-containing protein [Saprospiraceae bacterium]
MITVSLRWLMTITFSTIFVLNVFAQHYLKRILNDDLRKGKIRSVDLLDDDHMLIHAGIFYPNSYIESDIILLETEKSSKILKDFHPADQWLFILGRSVRRDKNYIYYSSRDIGMIADSNNVGWNFGILDFEGNQVLKKKIPIKPINGEVMQCYGHELVKNDEVILWGVGLHPDNDPSLYDLYIAWIRIKKDGTLISGPHYYNPPKASGFGIPIDAKLDIDSTVLLVFDFSIIRIKDNDEVETVVDLDFNIEEDSDFPKMEVTSNGDYLMSNYSKDNLQIPILKRFNKDKQLLWVSSFDVPHGYWDERIRPNVSQFLVSRIKEIKNGDILLCGTNFYIDSFYIKPLGYKTLSGGWNGSFMARFGANGVVKWVHFLADLDDKGKTNLVSLADIDEMEDGSILVGGSLGVKNVFNESRPFIMKLGANGCFDQTCSHVNKWWFFPDFVSSLTETTALVSPLLIYPNPGNEKIYVQLPGHELPGSFKYSVLDTKGRMHISGTVNSDDLSIDMSYIPSGIYIIHMMDSQGRRWTGKWVKD